LRHYGAIALARQRRLPASLPVPLARRQWPSSCLDLAVDDRIVSSFAFYAGSNAGYFGTSSAVIGPLAVQGYIWLSYMPQGRVADHTCKGSNLHTGRIFSSLVQFFPDNPPPTSPSIPPQDTVRTVNISPISLIFHKFVIHKIGYKSERMLPTPLHHRSERLA
jgi:hypothetical protein